MASAHTSSPSPFPTHVGNLLLLPRARSFPRRVTYLDCGALFSARAANPGAEAEAEVNLTLMPDGLHPNSAGYRLLLACFERGLASLEAEG